MTEVNLESKTNIEIHHISQAQSHITTVSTWMQGEWGTGNNSKNLLHVMQSNWVLKPYISIPTLKIITKEMDGFL